ncbi:phage head morphogenesis protein, partial [Salmonella enterica]|nr:phage head morphogenesis protein [Salmonella enterica]
KNIMETRRGGNDIRTLGFMSGSVADAVEQRTGEPPARLLAMSGKNVLHADSLKHHTDEIALSKDDFALLPSLLAHPEAVLWDKVHRNLMYIVETRDGTAKIVVNAPYGIKRQPDKLDVVINAYRVNKFDIAKAIEGGKLELIEGEVK